MKINKYIPFAFIYFFFNSLALPFGLTYTAILSPFFYWWVIMERRREVLVPFFVCLSPFVILHFISGVDTRSYLISIVNYTMVYIFCQAFFTFLTRSEQKEKVFRALLISNFILCLAAVPFLFTSYQGVFWMTQDISDGVENFKRLKLFTYEASYYALLFVPLFFYYFLQVILAQNKMNSWLLLAMLLIPYVLSFSIGVIGCLLFSLAITYLIYARRLSRKKRLLNLLALSVSVSAAGLLVAWLFFPNNGIFLRFENIFTGTDTSGKGRTSEAFMLALTMLEQKSYAFGIGVGQIKILGEDIIRSYYLYSLDYTQIAIPNAAAETLAMFGWVGLALRLLLELFLFFYTRVWTNYYRLLLFIFVFVYQFTGSFITNIAEYVIWILAFTNVFTAFNVIRNTEPVKVNR